MRSRSGPHAMLVRLGPRYIHGYYCSQILTYVLSALGVLLVHTADSIFLQVAILLRCARWCHFGEPGAVPWQREYLTDALHTPALTFRESKIHPDCCASRECRKQSKGTPCMHIPGHVGESARDPKVQKILVCEGNRHYGTSQMSRADF